MKKVIYMFMFMCSMVGIQADSSDYSSNDFNFDALNQNFNLQNSTQSTTYSIQGFDPYLNIPYTGVATITRQGDVYAAYWVFNDGLVQLGTGLRDGDHLSFVFADAADPLASLNGVIAYDRHSRDHLRGEWIYLGQSLIGTEELTRINN